VGFRLAMARPERVTAITQNGNAYEEGLSTGWNPIQKYWQEPTAANREAIRAMLTPETTKWQYVHRVRDEALVAPESYTLDSALLARPGNDEIQLDLFLDYVNNVALYPKFYEYFATERPPLLAVWGKNDPFFLPPGAEAYRRDIPNAEVHFYDTGHSRWKRTSVRYPEPCALFSGTQSRPREEPRNPGLRIRLPRRLPMRRVLAIQHK
jgi:pimeloyl-ACP methyl ester carboxylesterase